MEYTTTDLPQSRVQIDVTLPAEEWEKHKEAAEQELAKDVEVEGFRKGNVPIDVARQQIGEDTIAMETARKAVEEAYKEIMQKEEIDAIGEPELEVKKLAAGNPFEFTLTVSKLPSLDLPDYKQVASEVSKQEPEVTDKEVEDALQWLQQSRTGEDGSLPELNDEFAQSLGQFESLDQLKEQVRAGLKQEKEQQEQQRLRQEILQKIAEKAEGEVPQELIDRERQEMMQNLKNGVQQQMNIEFDEYLKKVEKTEEQLTEEFGKEAEQRVKRSLALREVAKQEEVEPTEEEIEQGTQQVLGQYQDPEQAKQQMDPAQLRAYAKGALENEKALEILEGYAKEGGSQESSENT